MSVLLETCEENPQLIVADSLNEAIKLVKEYENSTSNRFVSRSCPKDFGKAAVCLKGKNIHWIKSGDSKNEIIPYVIIGKKQLDCQYGKDQKKHVKENRKAQQERNYPDLTKRHYRSRISKKHGCPAKIVLRDVIYFQNYKVSSDTKHFRYVTGKKLKDDFQNCKHGNITRHILVCLPSVGEHSNHPEKKSSGNRRKQGRGLSQSCEMLLEADVGAFLWPAVVGFPSRVNEPSTGALNERPIIGILSQELSPGLLPPHVKGTSYIAASYVKYIESAGGRVVPILTTMSKEEIEEIFHSINGVLYPGGGATLFASRYFSNADQLYNLAVKANQQGDFFPIWGTCLGFQAMSSITAGKPVVSSSNAIDLTLPLNFSDAAKGSRMFKEASNELMNILSTEGVTYNYHYNCVTPETFSEAEKLKDCYNLLSYNVDVNGKTFVSTIEGKELPFYGTQWHPEKNAFEWSKQRNIAHSKDAVKAAQYVADFFVNEARKSKHRFKSEELEDKYLIYNFNPINTAASGHFEQCYVF
eukprot:gene17439-9042_t